MLSNATDEQHSKEAFAKLESGRAKGKIVVQIE